MSARHLIPIGVRVCLGFWRAGARGFDRPVPTTSSSPAFTSEIEVERGPVTLLVHLRGTGEPLLFLHGLGSDAQVFSDLLGEMRGRRLAMPDQRGHGGSTPIIEPKGYSLEEMTRDAEAVFDELNWQTAVIGGASMGAAVALNLAQQRPELFSALVLASPAMADEPHPAIQPFARIAKRVDEAGINVAAGEVAASLEADGMSPDEAAAAVGPWLRQHPKSFANGLRTVIRWQPLKHVSELSPLHVPTVIVAYPGDPWHPLALAQRMHAAMSNSRLVTLASAKDFWTSGNLGSAVNEALVSLAL
jgi:3-oxoadipate enol-lactonase